MATSNSGVCVRGQDQDATDDLYDFYGNLRRIVRLEYPGFPLKRTFLFDVDWYDPTPSGTRKHELYQMVEINHRKRYRTKYEPFILATQARQVVFIEYPSLKRDKVDWLAAMHIQARSRVEYIDKDDSITNSYQEEVVDETARKPVQADDEFIDLQEDQFIDLTIAEEDEGMCVLYA